MSNPEASLSSNASFSLESANQSFSFDDEPVLTNPSSSNIRSNSIIHHIKDQSHQNGPTHKLNDLFESNPLHENNDIQSQIDLLHKPSEIDELPINNQSQSNQSVSIDSQQYQKIQQHRNQSLNSQDFSFNSLSQSSQNKLDQNYSIKSYQIQNPADSSLNQHLEVSFYKNVKKIVEEELKKGQNKSVKQNQQINLHESKESGQSSDLNDFSGMSEEVKYLNLKEVIPPIFTNSHSSVFYSRSRLISNASNSSNSNFYSKINYKKAEQMDNLERMNQQHNRNKSFIQKKSILRSYLAQQEQKMRMEQQRKKKQYIKDLLQELGFPITQQNLISYNQILVKTLKFAQTHPFIKKLSGGLFMLDLKVNSTQFPIKKMWFVELGQCPKQLVYRMHLGPHLTQKMVQKLFAFDWPNLRNIKFQRSVRQTIIEDQTFYYVTENKNNFDFLANFKNRSQLFKISVEGNYFTDKMAISLFNLQFASLKQLTIAYDAAMSEYAFNLLLQKIAINFSKAQVTIRCYNQLHQTSLRKLLQKFWQVYPNQISNIIFERCQRQHDISNRPYVKQLDEIASQGEDQIIQENMQGTKKTQLQKTCISLLQFENPNEMIFEQSLFQDQSKSFEEGMQQNQQIYQKSLNNSYLQKTNIIETKSDRLIESQLNMASQQFSLIQKRKSYAQQIFQLDLIELDQIKPIQQPIYSQQCENQQQDEQGQNDLQLMEQWNSYQKIRKDILTMQMFSRHIIFETQPNPLSKQHDFFVILDFTVPEAISQKGFLFHEQQYMSMANWKRHLFSMIIVDYFGRFHQKIEKIFDYAWDNLKFLRLININYSHFDSYQSQPIKVKPPMINISVLKNHKLNERLQHLQIRGEYMPYYLINDLRKIQFKNLKLLGFLFIHPIKLSVKKMMVRFLFENILSECQIVFHSLNQQPDEHLFQIIIDYMIEQQQLSKYQDNQYYQNAKKPWRQRVKFISFYSEDNKLYDYDTEMERDEINKKFIKFQPSQQICSKLVDDYSKSMKQGKIQRFVDTNILITYLFNSALYINLPYQQIIKIIQNICLLIQNFPTSTRVRYLVMAIQNMSKIYSYHCQLSPQYIQLVIIRYNQLDILSDSVYSALNHINQSSNPYISLILFFLLKKHVKKPVVFRTFTVSILKSINLILPQAQAFIKPQISLYVYMAFYWKQRQDQLYKKYGDAHGRNQMLPIEQQNNRIHRKFVYTTLKSLKSRSYSQTLDKVVNKFMFREDLFKGFSYPSLQRKQFKKKIRRYCEVKENHFKKSLKINYNDPNVQIQQLI